MRRMSSSRAQLIDALRGFALFGILVVNIQSVVWGLSGPSLGTLAADSALTDVASVFFTALLAEYKFYPLFCFCFGYGFAVLARRWRARGEDMRVRFSRRLNFMLLLGVLHGSFIWFGDILSRYAVTGYILRRHLGKGPRALLRAARFWAIVAVALLAVIGALLALSGTDAADSNSGLERARDEAVVTAKIDATLDIYLYGSYAEIARQRITDYLEIFAYTPFIAPQIMLMFLLGAVCAQLGLLARPARYRQFWRRVLIVALCVGVPANIFYAFNALTRAQHPGMASDTTQIVLQFLIPILAFAYIAALALIAPTALGVRLLAALAPAGKLALSNYLLQSVVMTTLLYSYGLALGATLNQFGLFITACIIYACQLLLSYWYLRHFAQGPMEKLWRKFT